MIRIFDSNKKCLLVGEYDLTGQEYVNDLNTATELIETWKKSEDTILRKLNTDTNNYSLYKYLDSLSLHNFFLDSSIERVTQLVENDSDFASLLRLREVEIQLRVILPTTKNFENLKARFITSCLVPYSQIYPDRCKRKTIKPLFSISKPTRVLDVQSNSLYEFLSKYPWIWLFLLYQFRWIKND